MQKIISTIKECMTGKTCCEETGADCNQGRACPVRAGTHKPAEAVHQIQEPTVNQQLTDERAALAATPAEKSNSAEFDGIKTAAPVVLPEPDLYVRPSIAAYELPWQVCNGSASAEPAYLAETVRALLATGGQGRAVEQAPVLYVSKEHLDSQTDHANSEAGRYLPCRITPAGKFTTPLFAAPQQADARCLSCNYQHGHAIGCENNPVDIVLKAQADARDAGRWRMASLIHSEMMKHPDIRAEPEAASAYMKAVHDGVCFEAAIDAAIAAAKGNE